MKCDGKCHLATQLTEIENDTEENPFPPNNIESNLEISFSLLENDITIQTQSSKLSNQSHFNYTPSTSDGHYSILSPPPRA